MAVYDPEKEKQDTAPKHDGSHDDLGMHPERREAEVDDLERAFDAPSAYPEGLSPEELESRALEAASEVDDSGFYNESSKDNKTSKLRNNLSKRKTKAIILAAVVSSFAGIMTIGNLLNNFQLESIFNNIDQRTFARINASYEGRSDAWLRTFIRLRLSEFGGDEGINQDADTLFFRSGKVDNDDPIRDWYKTLRSSNFEKRVFNDSGVFFTSSVDKDGNFRPAKVTVNFDTEINQPGLWQELSRIDTSDPAALSAFLNQSGVEQLDNFVDVEFFDSNDAARKSVIKTVNDKVAFWRVLERRQRRRDILNQTGIRDWKFFAQTREEVNNKKSAVQRKIINKVFSGNNSVSKVLKCIFGGASCSATTDPSSPENKPDGAPSGDTATDPADEETQIEGDGDTEGETISTGDEASSSLEEAGEALGSEAGEEIAEEATEEATQEAIELTGKELFTKQLIQIFARGGPTSPTFYWNIAKKLTAVHNFFGVNEDGTSRAQTIVYTARAAQLAATYGTYRIANDQIKSGELVGDEVPLLMETMNNFQSSEGWSQLTRSNAQGVVSAQEASEETPNKESYCNKDVSDRAKERYAFFCDDEKPNGGGNAERLTETYNNTVGAFIAPIAEAVNGVRNIPGVRALEGIFEGIIDNTIGAVVGPLANSALGSTAYEVLGNLFGKLTEFLGASPKYAEGPMTGNYLVGGGAVNAESHARGSGAQKSTPETRRYSSQLAANFIKEQQAQQSTLERYASLQNPNSLASKGLMNLSTFTASASINNLLNSFVGTLKNIGSIFTGGVFAQTPECQVLEQNIANPDDEGCQNLADWAGVTQYDIPEECMTMDPLNRTIQDGTNYDEITGESLDEGDWDMVRSTDDFYEAAYDWAGEDPDRQGRLSELYNCHLLDTRVMGGLGYTSGYTDDDGYEVESSSGTSASLDGVTCPDNLEAHPSQSGYFKMPEAPNGEYSIYSDDADRYGSQQLVCVLYSVALAYNEAMGGRSKMDIGDLNASGHKSHYKGIAADLDAQGEVVAADNENFGSPPYSTEATITLGKLFVDTGAMKNLWWCDDGDGSTAAIEEYAISKGTPFQGIKCISGHYNHFHIDIKDEYALPGRFTP